MLNNGYLVRAHRLALGMTLNDLAYEVGISGAWLSMLERGKVEDDAMIVKLIDAIRRKISVSIVNRDLYDVKVAVLLIDIYRRYQREVPDMLVRNARACCLIAGMEARNEEAKH